MIKISTYSQDMLNSLLASLERLEKDNTKEEIKDHLKENNSYLLAEFRPYPDSLRKVLDVLEDHQRSAILDSLDSLFLEYLFLKYLGD